MKSMFTNRIHVQNYSGLLAFAVLIPAFARMTKRNRFDKEEQV